MGISISRFLKDSLRKSATYRLYRDFSRFSEERPLPHVVYFEAVTLSVVTPLCAFGALEGLRVSSFRALTIGTDPVHGLIIGNQPSDFACFFGISMIR